jgi:hypothetical protein
MVPCQPSLNMDTNFQEGAPKLDIVVGSVVELVAKEIFKDLHTLLQIIPLFRAL